MSVRCDSRVLWLVDCATHTGLPDCCIFFYANFFCRYLLICKLNKNKNRLCSKTCGIDKIAKIKEISKRKIMFKHYNKVYFIF